MKRNFLLQLFALASLVVSAQQTDPVLMTVNGKPVYRSEFEYIYNKNSSLHQDEVKGVKDYLRLFIDFKLKIAEAEQLGVDTTTAFKREYLGYRNQLSKNYLTDTVADTQAARQYYEHLAGLHQVAEVQMQHIFKYLPQSASRADINRVSASMDSLSVLLQKNPERFDEMVTGFSDDKRTLTVGCLQTPEDFENRIFSMKDGEISRPFFSPQGMHIVKILKHSDLLPFEEMKKELIYRLARVRGVSPGTLAVVERLKKEYGFTVNQAGYEELLAKGTTATELFRLGEKHYTGNDLVAFARGYQRPIRMVYDIFVLKSVLDYELDRLDEKYPEFGLLMKEYKEGMMLFERSNQEVWQRAANDTVGQEAYFASHLDDYKWEEPHYKGVVLHAVDKRILKEARCLLKKVPQSEQAKLLTDYFNADGVQRVVVEEGIFKVGDNPFVDELKFRGKKAEPVKDFPYVKFFGQKQKYPESYKVIKGQVVSDYQKLLEDMWVKQLRSKFEVVVHEEVLKTVNNH